MAYRVRVDRSLCIGAASCSAVSPNAFTLDNEGKSVVKKKDGTQTSDWTDFKDINETAENITSAAKGCPVNAIIIEEVDEKGRVIRQVWPS